MCSCQFCIVTCVTHTVTCVTPTVVFFNIKMPGMSKRICYRTVGVSDEEQLSIR